MSYSFNNDSTFCLNSWSDIVGQAKICGKWKINKDTILLFSNPDTTNRGKSPVITFNESHSDSSEIKVVIHDTHNEPVAGVRLTFNDAPEKYITGITGTLKTDYLKIHKITIDYIGIGTHSFVPKTNTNIFVITLNFDAIPPVGRALKLPEKLLWKGNTIYDLRNNKVITNYSFHKITGTVKKQE